MTQEHSTTTDYLRAIDKTVGAFSTPESHTEDTGPQWEYKIVVAMLTTVEEEERDLNLIGMDNWELEQVIFVEIRHQNEFWYYFKRRKGENNALPSDSSENGEAETVTAHSR